MAVAAAAAAGGLAWLAWAPAGDSDPHPFNHDRNAVWLEHRWLEKAQAESEMAALFERLHARGIAYVYPHLIPFDARGNLPPHDREQMRAFLATARRVSPDMKVLPWIGGLRLGWKRQRPGTLQLADLNQRQRIVAEVRGLVDEGFDGIHLNVEPVDDGNVEFLALLRAVRTAVGPGRVFSIAATRPAPFGLRRAPNFAWSPEYYARVASVVDQLVIMAYDTALPTPNFYRRYVRWASRSVAGALDETRLERARAHGNPHLRAVRLHAPRRSRDAGERAAGDRGRPARARGRGYVRGGGALRRVDDRRPRVVRLRAALAQPRRLSRAALRRLPLVLDDLAVADLHDARGELREAPCRG